MYRAKLTDLPGYTVYSYKSIFQNFIPTTSYFISTHPLIIPSSERALSAYTVMEIRKDMSLTIFNDGDLYYDRFYTKGGF